MTGRVLLLPAGRIAVTILALIGLLALLGPLLAPHDPLANSPQTTAPIISLLIAISSQRTCRLVA